MSARQRWPCPFCVHCTYQDSSLMISKPQDGQKDAAQAHRGSVTDGFTLRFCPSHALLMAFLTRALTCVMTFTRKQGLSLTSPFIRQWFSYVSPSIRRWFRIRVLPQQTFRALFAYTYATLLQSLMHSHIRPTLPLARRSPCCIYSHEIDQHSGNLLEEIDERHS